MEMNRIRAKGGRARIAYCIDFFFVFCGLEVLCLHLCFHPIPTPACRISEISESTVFTFRSRS